MPSLCKEGVPWKASLFSTTMSRSNTAEEVQSYARAACPSGRAPHSIGTPTLLPDTLNDTDRQIISFGGSLVYAIAPLLWTE